MLVRMSSHDNIHTGEEIHFVAQQRTVVCVLDIVCENFAALCSNMCVCCCSHCGVYIVYALLHCLPWWCSILLIRKQLFHFRGPILLVFTPNCLQSFSHLCLIVWVLSLFMWAGLSKMSLKRTEKIQSFGDRTCDLPLFQWSLLAFPTCYCRCYMCTKYRCMTFSTTFSVK